MPGWLLIQQAKGVLIYDLEGKILFAAAPILDGFLEEVAAEAERRDISYLVLRMKRVRDPRCRNARGLGRLFEGCAASQAHSAAGRCQTLAAQSAHTIRHRVEAFPGIDLRRRGKGLFVYPQGDPASL